ETDEERRVTRLIRQTQLRLGIRPERLPGEAAGELIRPGKEEKPGTLPPLPPVPGTGPDTRSLLAMGLPGLQGRQAEEEQGPGELQPLSGGPVQTPTERAALEDQLELLKQYLLNLKASSRTDQRISEEGEAPANELAGQPAWLSQWILEGKSPVMQFEMRPGETVQDALGFAGGFALRAFPGAVTLHRIGPDGRLTVREVQAGEDMARTALQRGDTLTALPLRVSALKGVTIQGWARLHGQVAFRQGERVSTLLGDFSLVLPDTYL